MYYYFLSENSIMRKKFNVKRLDILNALEERMDILNKTKYKDTLKVMKDTLKEVVEDVKFTNRLKTHPVCLTTEGPVSMEMEKVLSVMPNENKIKAKAIMEINANHPIANKIKSLTGEDLNNYAKILYAQARLIEGLTIDNPTEISSLICDIIAK